MIYINKLIIALYKKEYFYQLTNFFRLGNIELKTLISISKKSKFICIYSKLEKYLF